MSRGNIRGLIFLLLLQAPLAAQENPPNTTDPFVVVLGIAQDAGFPQSGCGKSCCAAAWRDPSRRRHVACLAIVDPRSGQRWLIDATPDFREQLAALDEIQPAEDSPALDGILLTHAHIGHYTGLMHLGREVMGARGVPVYAMPRMQQFLRGNGPWDQLVRLQNIELKPLEDGETLRLNARIRIAPLSVPHRDEYSETVGFRIEGPHRTVLYIPDIDKWERWPLPVETLIGQVDRAYLDGTFFDGNELPGRDMAEIPHPFVVESLHRFRNLPATEREKIAFIHLNHTNPLLDEASAARKQVVSAGFRVAKELEKIGL